MSDSAFKNMINANVVKKMGEAFAKELSSFDQSRFNKISKQLSALELKARVQLLTQGLAVELTGSYPQNLKIVSKVLKQQKLSGFELWPISEYISEFGTDHFDESLEVMKELTQQFTSEFAIRPFLIKDHQRVLKKLSAWTKSDNVHVRRWISEGTRPNLPWGGKIPAFIKDASLTLPFLEQLKYDEELYVRKSVANHLNDISKTHPDLLVSTLTAWNKNCLPEHKTKIQWITRHALRTLIKKGHPGALKLMGVGGESKIKVESLKISKKLYKLGDDLEFEFIFQSTTDKKQKLIVDYLIHFVKSNGKTSHKVFKLKSIEVMGKEKVQLKKKHSLKKITTMTFYKGKHKIAIQVNGKVVEEVSWMFHP